MNNNTFENSEESTGPMKAKKVWSKPEVWILDRGYVEGGADVYAYHEAGISNGHYYIQNGGNAKIKTSKAEYSALAHS